jgi:hypothetical protein
MEASVPLGQGSAITAKRVGLMLARLRTPDALPAGVWQGLLQHAYSLIDEIAVHGIQNPFWTFGGGTVLMLRYRHRMSKDIDIFVPDPQYLGFVSPLLSDVDEAVSDIERKPVALATASSFLTPHRGELLKKVEQRRRYCSDRSRRSTPWSTSHPMSRQRRRCLHSYCRYEPGNMSCSPWDEGLLSCGST